MHGNDLFSRHGTSNHLLFGVFLVVLHSIIVYDEMVCPVWYPGAIRLRPSAPSALPYSPFVLGTGFQRTLKALEICSGCWKFCAIFVTPSLSA